MARFIVASWKNTDPAEYAVYDAAEMAALARAKKEGRLVKLRDTETEDERTVSPDGRIGHWVYTQTEREAADAVWLEIDEHR